MSFILSTSNVVDTVPVDVAVKSFLIVKYFGAS